MGRGTELRGLNPLHFRVYFFYMKAVSNCCTSDCAGSHKTALNIILLAEQNIIDVSQFNDC
jgi:hypothetical protein